MSKPLPADVVDPAHIARLSAEQDAQKRANNGAGNLLRVIADMAPDEIAELERELVTLTARIQDINLRIATLRTHALVSPKGTA